MTYEEFHKEFNRLTKLMARAAVKGNHNRVRELDAQAKSLFQNLQAHSLLNATRELETA